MHFGQTKSSNSAEFKFLSIWQDFPFMTYWYRLWIIQEFVLAKDLVLYLGEEVLEVEDFHALCSGINALVAQNKFTVAECLVNFNSTAPMRLYRERRRSQNGESSGAEKALIPLLQLVQQHGESECMDLRDRVFGLYSLAPQCCRDSTPVDYSTSRYHTCGKLVGHYFRQHCLDFTDRLRECRNVHGILDISWEDCQANAAGEEQSASIKSLATLLGEYALMCLDYLQVHLAQVHYFLPWVPLAERKFRTPA